MRCINNKITNILFLLQWSSQAFFTVDVINIIIRTRQPDILMISMFWGGFLTLEAMLCNKLTSDPMCSKEGIYSIGLRQFKNCVYLVLQFANKPSI